MRFTDALSDNQPPHQVGEVRFRYEGGLLWAERKRPSSLHKTSETLILLSVIFGLVALGVLVLSPRGNGALLASAGLVALAAASAWAASRSHVASGRHRFVLDFGRELLRLERYSRVSGPARRYDIPFDDVLALHVTERQDGTLSLLLRHRTRGSGEAEQVLIPDVPAQEAEGLHRIWRMLHHAFGLKDEEQQQEEATLPLDDFEPGQG